MKRPDRVIAFIEKFCKVPDGKLVGQPIKLIKFQKDFIKDVYGEGRRTRRAILSIARKNGKTALMACLILVHLVGTEARQNSQIVSGAMSRDQAALVFDLACKMIQQSEELSSIIRIIPSKKMLIGLPMNVTFQALAADGKTAQGLSPVFALIDEAGQVVGSNSSFISAIETAQGAHDDPLLMYISTQAANDSDYLSIIIDDAKRSDDPRIVSHVYEADSDCDLMDQKQWKKANPALSKFRSLDDVREQAKQASRMPSAESSFRNLILNQRISVNSPFVSKSAWIDCVGENPPIQDCQEIYGGLDLSGKTDLTSLVLVGLYDKKWHLYPYAWTPQEGVHERSQRDRAPYDAWVKQGVLRTTPSASISYEHIAHELAEIFSDIDIIALAYDRWRMDVLKKEFERIGLELPMVDWGQGFKDMAPAMDAMEGAILNKTVRHENHPVLNMCAQNTMVMRNPAGDRKPDKMKTSGRIDVMVAAIMAMGIAERSHELSGDFDDYIDSPLVL